MKVLLLLQNLLKYAVLKPMQQSISQQVLLPHTTNVTPYLDGAQYRALIVPQTTADGPLVVVTVDGVDYTLSRAMTFKANKQHKFTITLNKTSNGVNIGIGGWTEDEEDYGGSAE